jgi:hypothetical protein
MKVITKEASRFMTGASFHSGVRGCLTRNVIIKGMENITHYHHKDINPVWAKDLEYCGTIQDHMFYRLFKNQVMLSR